MLSLSPRYDQYRLQLPKEFLEPELYKKYSKLLASQNGVITDPMQYLNESIVDIEVFGIDDITLKQIQTSTNARMLKSASKSGLGRIKHEPSTEITYTAYDGAPIEWIDRALNINCRINQGFYNYFMVYEELFHKFIKPGDKHSYDVIPLYILGEDGTVAVRLDFIDVYFQGIDGLEFTYTNVERQNNTFTIKLVYNDIEVNFTPEDYDTFPETFSIKGHPLGMLD